MAISEEKLESWTRQGAITTSKITHEYIRNILDKDNSYVKDRNKVMYLQGSYKNSTNIWGDSDVDLIVEAKDFYYCNLSLLKSDEAKIHDLSIPKSNYNFYNFRDDVLKSLRLYFKDEYIKPGNKSVKIVENSNRISADVVICAEYRNYSKYISETNNEYIKGITFFTLNSGEQIINYPIKHFENGVIKNNLTNGRFKPMVRIFKNARTFLCDINQLDKKTAPSYFIENLLYNVPNELFQGSYQDSLYNILYWLWKYCNLDSFVCQNEQIVLFGSKPENWNKNDLYKFILKLSKLWDGGSI